MTYISRGDSAIDYMPCRYGSSKNVFRGPIRALDRDYIAVLGGSRTFGKFVENPFVNLLEKQLGQDCINFGSLNGGIDVFANDSVLSEICNTASATIIEVMGAASLSNRFYKVHPRHNDRFIGATALLKVVYQDLDFTDIHFVRHLLHSMHGQGPERFEIICEELQEAWVRRMQLLLDQIHGPVYLLWFSDHSVDDVSFGHIGSDPLFVNRTMIESLRADVTDIVEVVTNKGGKKGMKFLPVEEPAAVNFPDVTAHEQAARCLFDALKTTR